MPSPDDQRPYDVRLLPTAEDDFVALQKPVQKVVGSKLDRLESAPCDPPAKRLKGDTKWSVRAGQHRILYEVDHQARRVDVAAIKDRKDAYGGH